VENTSALIRKLNIKPILTLSILKSCALQRQSLLQRIYTEETKVGINVTSSVILKDIHSRPVYGMMHTRAKIGTM